MCIDMYTCRHMCFHVYFYASSKLHEQCVYSQHQNAGENIGRKLILNNPKVCTVW